MMKSRSDRFARHFPESLEHPRTIGREAEFPVVHADGTAADVRPILQTLFAQGGLEAKREGDLITGLDSPGAEYSLEVGWGTVEVITGPHADLHALKQAHEAATARVVAAAAQHDAFVLGVGTQPITPGTPALLSPKERYKVLLDTLGELWLWFTVTASDQVHVDTCLSELASLTHLANACAPVTVALCANSPLHGGQPTGFASSREGFMGRIEGIGGRHGMPAEPVVSVEAWIEHLCRQPFLIDKVEGVYSPGDGRPFSEHPDPSWERFLVHEHYCWNSGRPRAAISTLEWRAACQQPPDEHMAAAALQLGLTEAAPTVACLLDEVGWPGLRAWHEQTVREGFCEPRRGLLADIVAACEEGLAARGLGEEVYLGAVHKRVERREAPAAETLRRWQDGSLVQARAH